MAQKRIVSCRALDPVDVARAADAGIELIGHDFLIISMLPVDPERMGRLRADLPAVFTSHYAVKSCARNGYPQKLEGSIPAFAIRGRTSDLAEGAGWELQDTAESGAELAKKILASGVREVVYFTTAKRRPELEETLISGGVTVWSTEVYRKELNSRAMGPYDGVLFFSPSQVDAFVTSNPLAENATAFCIGPTTARSAERHGYQQVVVADKTSEKALLKEIYEYSGAK